MTSGRIFSLADIQNPRRKGGRFHRQRKTVCIRRGRNRRAMLPFTAESPDKADLEIDFTEREYLPGKIRRSRRIMTPSRSKRKRIFQSLQTAAGRKARRIFQSPSPSKQTAARKKQIYRRHCTDPQKLDTRSIRQPVRIGSCNWTGLSPFSLILILLLL